MVPSEKFVIVVEGVDKTGKTSLANGLSEILGWPIKKFSQPKPGKSAAAEYMDAVGPCGVPGPFIADRFHLGESVYGPIYRKTEPMHVHDHRMIERALVERGCLLVLMTDSPDVIVQRFLDLGEDFAKAEHVEEIVKRFDELWLESRLPRVRFRWADDLPDIVAMIVREMRR